MIQTEADYTIAVESAAVFLHEKNHPVDRIVGDFDSSNLATIQTLYPDTSIYAVSAVKDETDSELALNEALMMNPDRVYMYTNVGVRLDHVIANVRLLLRGPVTLINDHVRAYVLRPGTHSITPSHTYVSFFAFEPVNAITLTGFKYPLASTDLDIKSIQTISNEGSGTVTFESGTLLVIEASD
jgi:thiamine pyrophosphokinase